MACGPGAVDAVREHPGVSMEDDAQDILVGSGHGLWEGGGRLVPLSIAEAEEFG